MRRTTRARSLRGAGFLLLALFPIAAFCLGAINECSDQRYDDETAQDRSLEALAFVYEPDTRAYGRETDDQAEDESDNGIPDVGLDHSSLEILPVVCLILSHCQDAIR